MVARRLHLPTIGGVVMDAATDVPFGRSGGVRLEEGLFCPIGKGRVGRRASVGGQPWGQPCVDLLRRGPYNGLHDPKHGVRLLEEQVGPPLVEAPRVKARGVAI